MRDPGQERRLRKGIPVVPVFDGYRAVAIFGIVAYHILGQAPFAGNYAVPLDQFIAATLGQMVNALFIVSGFVVFLPTATRGEFGSLGGYAIRRAARLLPAYYLILIVAWFITSYHTTTLSIGAHALGLQTLLYYLPDGSKPGFGVNGPVWTLTVEISFYLVLPIVAIAFYRRPRAGLLIAGMVALVWTQTVFHFDSLANFFGFGVSDELQGRLITGSANQLPFWVFSFALGMIGARMFTTLQETWSRETLNRWAPRLLIGATAGIVLFTFASNYTPLTDSLPSEFVGKASPLMQIGFSASLATAMVSLAFCSNRLQWLFANRGIRWLAEISYGVYLSHALILFSATFYWGLGFPTDFREFAVLAGFVVTVSVIYGYLTARFFEQPIRRYAQRFGARSS
ncbi:MAG: acyltransferase [Solirubrobacterales bacterium]|nr:acyltransferase [Solirubrobacterales bacterium]